MHSNLSGHIKRNSTHQAGQDRKWDGESKAEKQFDSTKSKLIFSQ